jgi:hypothetical protein
MMEKLALISRNLKSLLDAYLWGPRSTGSQILLHILGGLQAIGLVRGVSGLATDEAT